MSVRLAAECTHALISGMSHELVSRSHELVSGMSHELVSKMIHVVKGGQSQLVAQKQKLPEIQDTPGITHLIFSHSVKKPTGDAELQNFRFVSVVMRFQVPAVFMRCRLHRDGRNR